MIYILIRGRNCEAYIEECLKSLNDQTYRGFKVFMILDSPEDKSYYLARNFKMRDNPLRIYVNELRMGLAFNIWYGIKFIEKHYSPNPEDVIAILDADDYLKSDALALVDEAYREGYLCTYGSYIKMSKGGRTRISQPYQLGARVRKVKWHGSHLKTFKFKLWKHIPESCFKDGEKWGEAASDLALMFCIMELAGLERCKHILKCIYVWRDKTPFTTNRKLQKKWEEIFRTKKALSSIKQ